MNDVKIGQNMALLVDDEARPGPGRGVVTEETGHLGLGGDVDDALVGRVIDPNVVPLVGIEVLEHVFRRRRSHFADFPCGHDRARLIDWLGKRRGLRPAATRNLGQRRLPRKPRRSPNNTDDQHHGQKRRHRVRQDRLPIRYDRAFSH